MSTDAKRQIEYIYERTKNIIIKWLDNEFDSEMPITVDKLKRDFAPFNDGQSWNRIADEIYYELSMFK